MPKDITQQVKPEEDSHHEEGKSGMQEPLSGSKKIKNRNHSKQNHGEGRS